MDTAKKSLFDISVLKPALVLFIICGVCAALLSGVYVLTENTIAENALAEEREAIRNIFPSYGSHDTITVDGKGDCDKVALVYDASRNFLGYAATVSPMGFADEITIVVGVSSELKVVKALVTRSSETAGIGSKVGDENYLAGYIGADETVAFGSGVDAVSGATRSSKAVLKGVKSAIEACRSVKERS